jgi:hypothetical protein
MKICIFCFFLFFSQTALSFSLIEVLSNSIKNDSKVSKFVEVVEINEKKIIESSLVSAFPLIQYYKGVLSELSLPAYFSIIPIIESRNRRLTTSSAGAVGVWQFLPQTARAYGLIVDSELDQRQDIVLSTRAAAQLLSHLYIRYQDPIYVLIAYNWGSGNLDKLIRRFPNISFAQLNNFLPDETKLYVKSFIKHWSVIQSSDTNIRLIKYPNEPYFSLKNSTYCNEFSNNNIFKFLNTHNSQGNFCLLPNEQFNIHFKSVINSEPHFIYSPPDDKCRSYSRDNFIVYMVNSGDTHKEIADALDLHDSFRLKLLNQSSLQPGTIIAIPKFHFINAHKRNCGL